MLRKLFILVLVVLMASVILGQDDDPDTITASSVDLPLTDDVIYSVSPGDSLEVIAARFDVSLACLRETNDLTSNREDTTIQPGDKLFIRVDCPFYVGLQTVDIPREDARGADTGPDEYMVQVGDTLDTIAQGLNISIISLQIENDLVDDVTIKPGQVLTIPADAPPYGKFPALEPLADSSEGRGGAFNGETIVVQPGNTLDTIGQEFDVSVISLQIANGLEDNGTITPGQILLIPNDAPSYGVFPALDNPDFAEGELYVVQPSDTLSDIALAYDVAINHLKKVNGLESDRVSPGTTLLIPDEGPRFGETVLLETNFDPDEVDGELYVVQPRESLDSIGRAFNVSVISLQVANGLEDDVTVQIGQTIIIPNNAPPYGVYPALDEPNLAEGGGAGGSVDGKLYVIQPLDNLDQIAADFNVLTGCLVEANEISDVRAVRPGQTILIPAEGCPVYTGAAVPRTFVPEPPSEGSDSAEDKDEAQGQG